MGGNFFLHCFGFFLGFGVRVKHCHTNVHDFIGDVNITFIEKIENDLKMKSVVKKKKKAKKKKSRMYKKSQKCNILI